MPYSQHVEGLAEFQRELKLLPDEILAEGEKIVGKGMSNIKRDVQRRTRAGRWAHLPHLPRAFSYDVTRRGGVIRGEGGADMEKLQGKLDVFIEYGTATSPPHPRWGPALDAEVPNFEKYAEDYLAKLVGG